MRYLRPPSPPGDARRYGIAVTPDEAVAALNNLVLTHSRVDTAGLSTDRIPYDRITLPAGRFVVTDPSALFTGSPSDGRRTRGVLIEGAGRYATELVFDPTAAAYLFDNNDRVSRLTVRDLTFTGASANASFMRSHSAGGPQGYIFERVVWRGTWTYGLHLTGTDVNSEFVFNACTMVGDWDTFLLSENVQVLNHNFFGCDMEPDTGSVLHYVQGGHVNVIGGSWIGGKNNTSGTGTLIRVDGPGGAAINRLHVEGVRVEHRSQGYKLIECGWTSGTVSLKSVHDVGYQADPAPAVVRARFTADSYPIVTFESCRLAGQHEYVSAGQNDTLRRSITYRDCTIESYTRLSDFIVTTLTGAGAARDGARAPVRFDGCRTAAITTGTADHLHDQLVNGLVTKNAVLRRHTVSMKSGFGDLPLTGGSGVTARLPLNAIVTSVRAFAPASASSGTNVGWSYHLQTAEAVPAVLFSKGGAETGAGQSTGFNLEATPFFVCSSDSRRQLTLTAGENTAGSGDAALFLVEYLS